MTQDELKKFEPFWDKWYLEERLGGGSFGDVYRIKREEYGTVYYAALKVISIPKDRAELNEVALSCGTEERTKTYYDNIRKTIVNEINIMMRLKGKTNVVSYEDHDILPKNHGKDPGYDIFIRMELLEDIGTVAARNIKLLQDNREIVQIGKDICNALNLCHMNNIIHRDIKPGNIFRSQDGDYKLGDFGIARSLSDSQMTMSIKGTFDYMAPEVYNREHYDFRADIYSLGMVLYYILNGFRGPFLQEINGIPTVEQKEKALMARMKGEALTPPLYASDRLSEVILKACMFKSSERYNDMEEFKKELSSLDEESLMRSKKFDNVSIIEVAKTVTDKTISLVDTSPNLKAEIEQGETIAFVEERETGNSSFTIQDSSNMEINTPDKVQDKQKRNYLYPGIIGGCLIMVVVAFIFIIKFRGENENLDNNVKTDSNKEKTIEKETIKKKQKEESDTGVVTQIIAKPLCINGIEVIEKKEIERYPEGVYVGDKLEEIKLKGRFQVSENDDTEVEGTLSLIGKGKIKKSGNYKWIFEPRDKEKYEIIKGNIYITAIINESVVGLEALKKIKDKASLRDVDLSDCGLTDLSVLKGAENLTYLQLDKNNLVDISTLEGCKKLKFISLNDNSNLSDISSILTLKNLDTVFLNGTDISDSDMQKVSHICSQK